LFENDSDSLGWNLSFFSFIY